MPRRSSALGRTETLIRRVAVAPLVLVTALACVAGCTSAPSRRTDHSARVVACTRSASKATVVLTGPPDIVAAGATRAFFTCAPVVVVASASHPGDVRLAAARALRAHAPLLLTAAGAGRSARSAGPALRMEIAALRTRTVLAVGVPAQALGGIPRQVHVVTDPALLPRTSAPARLTRVVLLVHGVIPPRGRPRPSAQRTRQARA